MGAFFPVIDRNQPARRGTNDKFNDNREAQGGSLAKKTGFSVRHYIAPPTVIIELVWVLESADCDRATVAKALRLLFDLPNFEPMDFEAVLRALAL